MTDCKLGGYIYKWGEKIGLSDHFITKDKGPDIFDAKKSYPVTDESFLYRGYLMGIDVSEIGMEEIEYVHN